MNSYDVVLKKLDPLLVAGVRDVIPAYPEQGHLWDKLEAYERQVGAAIKGPCFTIYHADEPEIDAEVCEPLARPHPAGGAIQVHELPGVEQAATVIHHGPFTTIGEAYSTILQWIETNGYRVVGPVREVYLEAAQVNSQTDPNTVTEIQFPVEKI